MTRPLPVDESVLCPRCGARLAGPWVTWCVPGNHYTEDAPRAEPTARGRLAKPTLPPRSEEEIQAGIRGVLEAHGFITWTTSQKRASRVSEGLPDILFAGHNVVGCAEIKRSPKEDLRPAQQEFASVWTGNGGLCFRWDDESQALEFARRIRGDA